MLPRLTARQFSRICMELWFITVVKISVKSYNLANRIVSLHTTWKVVLIWSLLTMRALIQHFPNVHVCILSFGFTVHLNIAKLMKVLMIAIQWLWDERSWSLHIFTEEYKRLDSFKEKNAFLFQIRKGFRASHNVSHLSLKPNRNILGHKITLWDISADTSCFHPRAEPAFFLVSTYSRHPFKDLSVSGSSQADREGQELAAVQTKRIFCFSVSCLEPM